MKDHASAAECPTVYRGQIFTLLNGGQLLLHKIYSSSMLSMFQSFDSPVMCLGNAFIDRIQPAKLLYSFEQVNIVKNMSYLKLKIIQL